MHDNPFISPRRLIKRNELNQITLRDSLDEELRKYGESHYFAPFSVVDLHHRRLFLRNA